LLTVGWLTKLKGVDLIPAIAKKVFERFPDWRWVVIGKGEEEGHLQDKIRNKHLQSKLLLSPPVSADLGAIYQQASIYVMTSQLECFPMVLLEAMSFGIPAVAFDCPTGPSAIIRQNEDGTLVSPRTVDAIAESIIDMISDEQKRTAFGAKAYRNIDRFSPEKIYALWKQLLQNG
jgi:glycosyltransferase involved in cell wall biosynthesis